PSAFALMYCGESFGIYDSAKHRATLGRSRMAPSAFALMDCGESFGIYDSAKHRATLGRSRMAPPGLEPGTHRL
ncbi:MAG: hypothetical protein KDD53_08240, partial [Bdellovibrionales bacterium]|nr:hypothetical protein [Bdellovibrionales bacterium]